MSAITDAFSELIAAQTEATGAAVTATFAVAGEVGVVVSAEGFDGMLMGGGVGESGEVELQCLVSEFTAIPEKFSAVTYDGRSLSVLDVKESHGVYIIRVGDAAMQ